jgi:hypothetical protein
MLHTGREPAQLLRVHARLLEVILGGLDGIEHDEVIALVGE